MRSLWNIFIDLSVALGQHWFRWWLPAWQHQAIAWTNVDFSSNELCGIQVWTISQVLMNLTHNMCLGMTLLKLLTHLPRTNSQQLTCLKSSRNTSLDRLVLKYKSITSHYIDVIMTMMASQITSLTFVCLTIYSDADQRKHQSSASLAFVGGIHWDRWIPWTKGQLRRKCFHLMTSSCSISLTH